MSERTARIHVAVCRDGDSAWWVDPLGFPELGWFATTRDRLLRRLPRALRTLAIDTAPRRVHQRELDAEPVLESVTFALAPPARVPLWTEPLELTFDLLAWPHGDRAERVRVPALGIEIVVPPGVDRAGLIEAELRLALLRSGAVASLDRLQATQRWRVDELRLLGVKLRLPSPRQRARAAASEAPEASVLSEVAERLDRRPLAVAYEIQPTVARLAECLTAGGSALLVGPTGVGKTAALHELIRSRADHGLGGTAFWATSGARLVAGQSGYGMWQERVQRLCDEVAGQRAVLHLGALHELLEVGKSEHQQAGIASFLRPRLARGELRVVVECLPEQLPLIEQQDPQLLRAFEQLTIEEPEPEVGRRILAASADAGRGARVSEDGLSQLDRLHRRYATYSAYPGRPLRMMAGLRRDAEPGTEIDADVVTRAFAARTGLPRFLLDDAVPFDREQARRRFAARVIGQPEAVEQIVDVLAAIKASLTRPRRPIASLLLIGPTGVGKTEMAKALAADLFGDERRLTRLDMSEYADPWAVRRLIGGEDGRGLLTGQIREQPFTVLLLDEVEKAHPAFFDLLLQVLGEARLTDVRGRVAEFTNTVVLLTSNLGAEGYVQAGLGFDGDSLQDAAEHFQRAVQAVLRPELIGRLDRLLPFLPLGREVVEQIARRELDLVACRDGVVRRGLALTVAAEVAPALAERGYEPRYGARPLKRRIERELLAPLASAINAYASSTPLSAEVALDADRQLVVRVGVGDGARDEVPGQSTDDVTDLRRTVQRLTACRAGRELANERVRLDQLQRRVARRRGGWVDPDHARQLARRSRLTSVEQRLTELLSDASALEDELRLAEIQQRPRPEAAQARVRALEDRIDHAVREMFGLRFDDAGHVVVGLYGGLEPVATLAGAYRRLALERGDVVDLLLLHPRPEDDPTYDPDEPQTHWRRTKVQRPERTLAELGQATVEDRPWGLLLDVRGTLVAPRMNAESGIHGLVEENDDTHWIRVHADGPPVSAYLPPAELTGGRRVKPSGSQPVRRRIPLARRKLDDPRLKKQPTWRGRDWVPALGEAIEAALSQSLREMLQAD